MGRNVLVQSGPLRYTESITVGGHVLRADVLNEAGGNDEGPSPYELLLAALGACKSMTVRMYAERKAWPLQGVHVRLSHSKVPAEDCAEREAKSTMIDRIDVEISFAGDLSEEQQNRLVEIADKCPVHRTLASQSQIDTRLVATGLTQS